MSPYHINKVTVEVDGSGPHTYLHGEIYQAQLCSPQHMVNLAAITGDILINRESCSRIHRQ